MASLLQPATVLPRENTRPPRVIKILHPDYPTAENTLLHLRALDDGGIDYDTALVACGIVTGNTSTGFLATCEAGAHLERVVRPDDNILRGSEYFFQLPDALEHPYPVVARFEDWTFPHNALPSPWNELGRQEGGRMSCHITDCKWGLEKAHLVPYTAQNWWDREELEQYLPYPFRNPNIHLTIFPRYITTDRFSMRNIDASDNVISLRSDIHTVFDNKTFAIVPKRDRGRGDLSLVVHIVNPIPDSYFNWHYHNRKLLPLECSIECLFARFAWTIFSPGVLGAFLTRCTTSRSLLVLDPSTGTATVESRSYEQVQAILAASRSRSASPKKRVASEAADDHQPHDNDLYHDDTEDSGFVETRGRSRKRRWASPPEQAGLAHKRGRAVS